MTDNEAAIEECPRTSRGIFWGLLSSTAGVFGAVSIWRMTRSTAVPNVMSTAGLIGLVCIESVMATVWLPVLSRRGWRLSCVTRPLGGLDPLRAGGVFVSSLVGYWFTWYVTTLLAPDFARLAAGIQFVGRPTWWAIALVALLNPLAEEFLYLGFVARVLSDESSVFAVTAAVLVRLVIHLYQGPLAIISILPVGVIFGAYYLRTQRIWPVVLAHMGMDAWALGRLAGAA